MQLPKTPESDGFTGDGGVDGGGGGGGGGGRGNHKEENKAGFAVFTHFSENPSLSTNQKSGKPRKGNAGKPGKNKKGGAKPKVQASSGEILASSTGPSDDDNHVMGKKVVRRDGNVSRRGMSFLSVPLTLPLEPLTWCGGAPLPSRNCLPLPLLHHLPPFPSRLPFLLSPSSFPLFFSFFFTCPPFSLCKQCQRWQQSQQ